MGRYRVDFLARCRACVLDLLQSHRAHLLERTLAPYLLGDRARGYSLILANNLRKGEHMNIDGATYEKHGDSIRRKVVESYTLENNWRVKVYTTHDKARKAYYTSISECQVQQRDGYSMEFHAMFTDYSQIVQRVAVSRYSWHTLEQAHNLAVELHGNIVRDLIASRLNVAA